jgi:hypothetical protein
MGGATGLTGAAEPGSAGGLDTGAIFTGATVTRDSGEDFGGPGDSVSADGGVAAFVTNGGGAGKHEDGGCSCSISGDGLGRGDGSSSGGDPGGDRDKRESDGNKLLSGSFSLRSLSSHCLFLAYLIGGSAVGEGVQTWDDELVG